MRRIEGPHIRGPYKEKSGKWRMLLSHTEEIRTKTGWALPPTQEGRAFPRGQK